jgi:hypothetical protein
MTATDPRGNQITITGTGGLGFFGSVTDSDGKTSGWAAMCDSGDCVGCSKGQEKCDGICTDTNTSNTNCGACGKTCASDEFCNNGVCGCSSGYKCGTSCVDRYTDPNNCGACGFACASGKCSKGECECFANQTKCGTICIDTAELLDDFNNCGVCGNVCLSNQTCSKGTCINGMQGTNDTNLTIVNDTDNLNGTHTWFFSDETNFTTSNLTGSQGTPGINGTQWTNTGSTQGCSSTYVCGEWNSCMTNGTQTRKCNASNTCDTTIKVKTEMQRCDYGCLFDNPKCAEGSVCLDNQCITRECETDSDCIANDSCTNASCSSYKCEYDRQSGCSTDGSCVSVGTIQIVNATSSYCSSEGIWIPQIKENEICQNNYTCLSNQCSNGICTNPSNPVNGTPGILDGLMNFLLSIWNTIAGFFGFNT